MTRPLTSTPSTISQCPLHRAIRAPAQHLLETTTTQAMLPHHQKRSKRLDYDSVSRTCGHQSHPLILRPTLNTHQSHTHHSVLPMAPGPRLKVARHWSFHGHPMIAMTQGAENSLPHPHKYPPRPQRLQHASHLFTLRHHPHRPWPALPTIEATRLQSTRLTPRPTAHRHAGLWPRPLLSPSKRHTP